MQNWRQSWNRNLILLVVAIFFISFGFDGIYMSIYTNFIANDIHVQPGQLGVIESTRETPGFLSAFIAALTMQIPSPVLAGLTLLIMSVGIGTFSQIYTVNAVIFWAIFWSLGFHCWAPLQPTMVLRLTTDESKGKWLGQISGIGNLAGLTGMGLVAIINAQDIHLGKLGNALIALRDALLAVTGTEDILRRLFLVAGFAIAIAGVIVFFISRESTHLKTQRLSMKRKYRFYYALTFLEGCRKQVFITFAVYALVKVFNTSVSVIARLMIVNRIMNMIFAPIIGRVVDKIGERRSLTIYNASLIAVFCGYAMANDHRVLYVLYCIDSFLYLFSIAQTTYLNKIALPEDVRPALSMGVTMNHAAAVIVPLVGGLLWAALDRYDIVFYGGAVVAFISLIVSQFLWIDRPERS